MPAFDPVMEDNASVIPYRVALAGHGPMARALLEALLAQPDRFEVVRVLPWTYVAGRLSDCGDDEALMQLAELKQLTFGQQWKLNDRRMWKQLLAQRLDCLILATWGELLTAETITTLAVNGCRVVNIHPSLLPEYRGANPYAAVLLANETETGVSLHVVDAGMDTGPMIGQWPVAIEFSDTGGRLRARCAAITAMQVPAALYGWLSGHSLASPQPRPSRHTKAPSLTLMDGQLDIRHKSAVELAQQVRALQPWVECFFQEDWLLLPLQRTVLITTRQVACLPENVHLHGAKLRWLAPPLLHVATAEGVLELTVANLFIGQLRVPRPLWCWVWPWLQRRVSGLMR